MSQIILCITVDFFSLIIKIWGRNLGDGILSVYCIILSTFLFSKNFENFYFEVCINRETRERHVYSIHTRACVCVEHGENDTQGATFI